MSEKEIEVAPLVSRCTTAVDSESPPPEQGTSRSWSMGSYPKLSHFMCVNLTSELISRRELTYSNSQWPDVACFRRFGTLNAENLLFLQAEISHLEDRLKELRADEENRRDLRGLMA